MFFDATHHKKFLDKIPCRFNLFTTTLEMDSPIHQYTTTPLHHYTTPPLRTAHGMNVINTCCKFRTNLASISSGLLRQSSSPKHYDMLVHLVLFCRSQLRAAFAHLLELHPSRRDVNQCGLMISFSHARESCRGKTR